MNTYISKIQTSLIASLGFLLTPVLLFAQAAQAPAAEGAAAPSPFQNILPFVLMIAVFFFLIILPQSRRQKKQNEFLNSLERGNAVVTSTGLYGKIYGIADKVITLEIAPGVRVRVDRASIVGLDPYATSAEALPKESKEKTA